MNPKKRLRFAAMRSLASDALGQINEAIAILESGTPYERLHLKNILAQGQRSLQQMVKEVKHEDRTR